MRFSLLSFMVGVVLAKQQLQQQQPLPPSASRHLQGLGVDTTILAASPLIIWESRKQNQPDGSVIFDWAGVQALFTVSSATSVSATFNSTFLEQPQQQPLLHEEEEEAKESTTTPTTSTGNNRNSHPLPPSASRHLQDSSFPKFGVYVVIVDGIATTNVTIYPGVSTHILASNLDPTLSHNITLYYRTDPVFNTWPNLLCIGCVQSIQTFTASNTDPSSQPSFGTNTAALIKPRKLLILGDSITSGNAIYRSLCANASGDDLCISYGNKLCNRFNANCSILSVSSKGIYENCCDNYNITMKDLMLRTFAQNPNELWDWSSFVPDAVLINLGTNDSGHDSGTAWQDAFIATFSTLLINLATVWFGTRSSPSLLPIFVGAGPITTKYEPWVLQAMSNVGVMNGITNTHFVNFTGCTLDGCGHPGPVGHQQMYEIAEPLIASVMGWDGSI